jgi:similar to stage IV sporulation protein
VRTDIFTSIRGYVKVQVRGQHIELLLNRITSENMKMWDVRRTSPHTLSLFMPLSDFFKLRPLLKQTGCRVHVLKRYGLPFVLDRLNHRKFFAGGLLLFVLGLYLLSSLVWRVEVVGNEDIPTSDIIEVAEQHGIYPLQWKFRLAELDTLSNQLMKKLPDASWIGVEVRGTHIKIKVVESIKAEKDPLMNPRHLVSTSDAVVSKIEAEQGKSLVKTNTRVKRGDILISGKIGDEENFEIVVAKGEVKGLVWHKYELEIPLIKKYKVYTGDTKEKFHLVIGSRALQITGYGKMGFSKYETDVERSRLQWRKFKLPLGWMKEKLMAVKFMEVPINAGEAKAVGLELAKADIIQKYGREIEIKEENILHEKAEGGKVYITVLYEVEQEITQERIIVPGEYEQEQDDKNNEHNQGD